MIRTSARPQAGLGSLLAVFTLLATVGAPPAAHADVAGYGQIDLEISGSDFSGRIQFADTQNNEVFGVAVNLGDSIGAADITGTATLLGATASWTASVSSAGGALVFDAAGSAVCSGGACSLTSPSVSFVGDVSDLMSTIGLPDAVYTFDGTLTLSVLQLVPEVVLGATGTVALNAFRATATPDSTPTSVSVPVTFANSALGIVDGTVDVTFDQVDAACETLVTAASNAAGAIPGDVALAVGDYQASFFDVSTTCTGFDTATVCIHYPDEDQDGLVDGVSPLLVESRLRLLHRTSADGAFVDATGMVDTTANVVCGDVTSLSPFAVGVANCGSGEDCDDGNPGTLDTCLENGECCYQAVSSTTIPVETTTTSSSTTITTTTSSTSSTLPMTCGDGTWNAEAEDCDPSSPAGADVCGPESICESCHCVGITTTTETSSTTTSTSSTVTTTTTTLPPTCGDGTFEPEIEECDPSSAAGAQVCAPEATCEGCRCVGVPTTTLPEETTTTSTLPEETTTSTLPEETTTTVTSTSTTTTSTLPPTCGDGTFEPEIEECDPSSAAGAQVCAPEATCEGCRCVGVPTTTLPEETTTTSTLPEETTTTSTLPEETTTTVTSTSTTTTSTLPSTCGDGTFNPEVEECDRSSASGAIVCGSGRVCNEACRCENGPPTTTVPPSTSTSTVTSTSTTIRTTTSTSSTTSTTVPGCSQGQTLEAVLCRIDELIALVKKANLPNPPREVLLKQLDRARSNVVTAQGKLGSGKGKSAKSAISRSDRALTSFEVKLRSRQGTKTVSDELRKAATDLSNSIQSTMSAVRKGIKK